MQIRGNNPGFRHDPVSNGTPNQDALPTEKKEPKPWTTRTRLRIQQIKQDQAPLVDELTNRQMQQLRKDGIAAEKRANNTSDQRPVPGGGVDSIQVSPDAQRLAELEKTVLDFELPEDAGKIKELTDKYKSGKLNSADMMYKAAQAMLGDKA